MERKKRQSEFHASLLAFGKPLTDVGRHRPRRLVAIRCSDATIVLINVDALKCGSCLRWHGTWRRLSPPAPSMIGMAGMFIAAFSRNLHSSLWKGGIAFEKQELRSCVLLHLN